MKNLNELTNLAKQVDIIFREELTKTDIKYKVAKVEVKGINRVVIDITV